MDTTYKINKGIAFSTYSDYNTRLPLSKGLTMPPVLEVTDPRQLMHTPHGLRTVQDLYESLDGCINLHTAGAVLQKCLDAYLEAPSVETRATLDRARATHDVQLAKTTKIAEYERAPHETVTNGAGLTTTG